MDSLRILLTNNTLAERAGTELYVRDVALALQERGHRPVAYSTVLGEVAQEMKAAGLEVIDDLAALPAAPDVIHGHHHLETITALLHFPHAPAIAFCHGVFPWEETPVKFPRILRYIAVSNCCRDHLLEHGMAAGCTQVLLNFVDLQRFRPRPPLPPRPARALVFCNVACAANYLGVVREACQRAGLDCQVLGRSSGRTHPRPEEVLPQYDLVFAKGRAALEAMAVGAAVITCDVPGLGSLVTTSNFHSFRELNFGLRTLTHPFEPEAVLREINQYNAADAQEVSRLVRQVADREDAVDQLLLLYREVMQEYLRLAPDRAAEEQAAAAYLRWLSPRIKAHDHLCARLAVVEDEKKRLLTSKSWRLTRPLRQVQELLRRFRSR